MLGRYDMIVIVVAIVMFAGVMRAKYGFSRRRDRIRDAEGIDTHRQDAETVRLREEVKSLKERLAVIERITVEKENSLAREIEQLRDR
jgi:uncharacterized protein YlxW (UPF0749 family)